MSEEDREAWLDGLAAEGELLDLEEDPDPEEYFDPDGPPAPGEDELTAEEIAGIREVMDDQARAAATAARLGTTGALAMIAALSGRRGPGQPGSAHRFPGESSSRAAAFATGLVLDVTPGCPELPDSPTRPPGRMIPSAAPPMMSSWGYRAPGTGWRRTPRRASDNDTGCLSGCCPENGLDGRASSYARRVIPGTGSKSRSGVLENPVLV
jgi:hypothetical protein